MDHRSQEHTGVEYVKKSRTKTEYCTPSQFFPLWAWPLPPEQSSSQCSVQLASNGFVGCFSKIKKKNRQFTVGWVYNCSIPITDRVFKMMDGQARTYIESLDDRSSLPFHSLCSPRWTCPMGYFGTVPHSFCCFSYSCGVSNCKQTSFKIFIPQKNQSKQGIV